MKYLNYLKIFAVALLPLVCACSSEEEPDMSFDGVINNEVLDKLVNETSEYVCIDEKTYTMDCDDYLNGTGEWEELVGPWFAARSQESGRRWILSKGQLITPMTFRRSTGATTMDLVDAWDIYCNQRGYDKTIAVGRSISVDKEKHTLNFEPNTEYPWLHSHYFIYNIQKADGKYLAVTHDYPDQGPNDKGEIVYRERAHKEDLLFIKVKKPNMKKFQVFENGEDATLWMIKKMREYFGDTIDVYKYTSEGKKGRIIDLVELEYWTKRSYL